MRIFKHYIPWYVLSLMIIDGVILCGSIYASLALKYLGFTSFWLGYGPIYPKAVSLTLMALLIFYVGNLYEPSFHTKTREFVTTVVCCFVALACIGAAISFLIPWLRLSRMAYVVFLSLALPAMIGFRLGYYWLLNTREWQGKVLIIGNTAISQMICETLENDHNPGYNVVGLVVEKAPKPREKEPWT